MSTFITSFKQYQRICELQGIEATEENYSDIMSLTNSLLETPEEKRYVQVDLKETWKKYHKKYPEKTLDEFIQSRK